MTKILRSAACVLLGVSLCVSSAFAKGNGSEPDAKTGATLNHRPFQATDTVTFWCANLNQIWQVKVPVVVGRGTFLGGNPSVSPYCGDPDALTDGRFPVAVPAGSPFRPAGLLAWWTAKTYPPEYGAALEAAGFGGTFSPHSNSPAEDFMNKIVNILVEIYSSDTDELISEFNFDPRQTFKLVQLGDLFFGQNPARSEGDPAWVDRLPTFGFNVLPLAPMQSGTYYYVVYWTLSDWTWDGLGVEEFGNGIPPGEWFMAQNPFRVP